MLITMKDVWVAEERSRDFRRLAEERHFISRTLGADRGLTMADRMTGVWTSMQRSFSRPFAPERSRRQRRLHRGYPATEV